jgi:hypothetical protein
MGTLAGVDSAGEQDAKPCSGSPKRQLRAVLSAFEQQRVPGLTGTFELKMRDNICDDLDDQKNQHNDPVWHGVIFPGH